VPDEVVELAGHIKEVGVHRVRLKYDEDLSCEVNVVVVAEQVEAGEAEES